MPDPDREEPPRASISVMQGVAFIVGIVVGIGIFKSPQLVAQSVTSEAAFIVLWVVGGLVTLIGALVYAELGSTYPSGGGEYHFLSRALGQPVGLLFAWARVTVLQTGIIAAVAFVFGDYAQQLVPLGPWGPAIHAALALSVVTLVNLLGLPPGKGFQLALTTLTLGAIVAVVIAGLWLAPGDGAPRRPIRPARRSGLRWSSCCSPTAAGARRPTSRATSQDVRRNMVRVLVIATAIITLIYVLMNLAFLNILGLDGIRKSSAVGADAVRKVAGPHGATCAGAGHLLRRAQRAQRNDLHRRAALSRGRRRSAGAETAGPGCVPRRQPDRCIRRPRRGGDVADRLRRHDPRRIPGDGGLYGTGVLAVPAAGRHLVLRAAPSRAGARTPVPGSALSVDPRSCSA